MKNLVFFLEGRSEKEMLKGFLPRFLPKNIKKSLAPELLVLFCHWRETSPKALKYLLKVLRNSFSPT